MNNKYSKLIKNTFIVTVGDFGSKVLSFLIVPLYTFLLSTADYGKIDVLTTLISLIAPFSTLVIYESMLRSLVKKEKEASVVISNCFVVFLYGVLLTLLTSNVICGIFDFQNYKYFYIFIMIFNIYNMIFSQYFRSNEMMMAFSIYGVVNTFSFLIFNVLFLVVYKMGIKGYLLSMLITQIICALYVTIKGKVLSLISFKNIDFIYLKKMLSYSLPLVPNGLMWWIMNAGDKLIINMYMGDSYNGIYSIALKLPTILNMLYSLFMQAWQVSAIEEEDNCDNDKFHNNIFKSVNFILMIVSSFIIIVTPYIFEYLISQEYYVAYKYVPFICISTIVSCASTFLGTCYTLTKKTKNAFYTTFHGAIINLVLNFVFIKRIGLYGVILGTIMGFVVVYILRLKDYKKLLKYDLKLGELYGGIFILFLQSVVNILKIENKLFVNIVLCMFIFILNYNEIKVIINKIRKV